MGQLLCKLLFPYISLRPIVKEVLNTLLDFKEENSCSRATTILKSPAHRRKEPEQSLGILQKNIQKDVFQLFLVR